MAERKHIGSGSYLQGLNDVIDALQTAVGNMEKKTSHGLADALLYVGTESQNKAPVESGDLRGSLEITIDSEPYANGNPGGGIDIIRDVPDNALKGMISYNTPYAANQHEHTEYDHPMGGQAKYLESVLVNDGARIIKLIAGGKADD